MVPVVCIYVRLGIIVHSEQERNVTFGIEMEQDSRNPKERDLRMIFQSDLWL